MKKWIHIFNDRWYCRKSGENRIDESNRYYFINNAYFHHRNDGFISPDSMDTEAGILNHVESY